MPQTTTLRAFIPIRKFLAAVLLTACSCQTWQSVPAWNPGSPLPMRESEIQLRLKGDSTVILLAPSVARDSIFGYRRGGAPAAFAMEAVQSIWTMPPTDRRAPANPQAAGIGGLIVLALLFYPLFHWALRAA